VGRGRGGRDYKRTRKREWGRGKEVCEVGGGGDGVDRPGVPGRGGREGVVRARGRGVGEYVGGG